MYEWIFNACTVLKMERERSILYYIHGYIKEFSIQRNFKISDLRMLGRGEARDGGGVG